LSLLSNALQTRTGAHRIKRTHIASVLDVAGLTLLSVAAGLLAVSAGIAVAGASCLVLAWRLAQ
jgi:hypothetical protein